MSTATSPGEFYAPFSPGPALQCAIPANELGFPASVPHGGSANGGVIAAGGWNKISVGLTSTQAGQLSVQRFLDAAGTIPQGAAGTATLVANTGNVVNFNDGLPCASFQISVTNTGGVDATLSKTAVLLQA